MPPLPPLAGGDQPPPTPTGTPGNSYLDSLGAADKCLFGSGTGTVIYLSQDRTDVQFVGRILARALRALSVISGG